MEGSNLDSYVSLDINILDQPVVAYYDPVTLSVHYAYPVTSSGNCGLNGNWQCEIVESGGMGKGIQLYIPKSSSTTDKITLAYYNATTGNLRIAQFADSNGTCGSGVPFKCFDVDSIGTGIDPSISMAVDANGKPHIVYGAKSTNSLYDDQIRITSPVTFHGNCGPKISLFYTWRCDVEVDNTGSDIPREPEAIGVSAGGNFAIAYSSYNDPTGGYRLMFADQRDVIFLPMLKR